MQDVQIARYGTQQGREQVVLRHLQQLRIETFSTSHQIWFLGPDRKAKEDADLRSVFVSGVLFALHHFGSLYEVTRHLNAMCDDTSIRMMA